MTNTVEEIKEIPLIYPLVSVTFRTVQIIDGRPIDSTCEEVLNLKELGDELPKRLNVMVNEFRGYLKKLRQTVQNPQGRDALQRILDNPRPVGSQPLEAAPLSPDSEAQPH